MPLEAVRSLRDRNFEQIIFLKFQYFISPTTITNKIIYSLMSKGDGFLLQHCMTTQNFLSFYQNVPHLPASSDKECSISRRLRHIVRATSFQKLLASNSSQCVVSSNSLQVEQIVSRCNVNRSVHPVSMSNDTVEHQIADRWQLIADRKHQIAVVPYISIQCHLFLVS